MTPGHVRRSCTNVISLYSLSCTSLSLQSLLHLVLYVQLLFVRTPKLFRAPGSDLCQQTSHNNLGPQTPDPFFVVPFFLLATLYHTGGISAIFQTFLDTRVLLHKWCYQSKPGTAFMLSQRFTMAGEKDLYSSCTPTITSISKRWQTQR